MFAEAVNRQFESIFWPSHPYYYLQQADRLQLAHLMCASAVPGLALPAHGVPLGALPWCRYRQLAECAGL